jgi:spermidine synthase
MGFSALALVVSGAAALVYESVWARMLHLVFGVGDQAVATVLGAFFLGMALGAFLGGRHSRKVRSPARAYAILELFIGAWALLTLFAIPRIHELYAALGAGLGLPALTLVRLSLAMLVLLPPTVAMGATLPVLMRARPPEGTTWPSLATRLYLANTSGAIVGAALTGFVLLPRLGGMRSLVIAAGLSASAAAIVHFAGLERDEDAAVAPRPRRSPALFLGLAAATGTAALAGEVLWTRVLRIIVQGTTQAFAAMLVAFLSGLVLGGAVAARALRTVSPAKALFAAQLLAGTFVAGSIAAVPQLTRLVPLVVGERRLVPHEPWSLLLVSFALLLPLATCLGASLPILFRMAESGDAGSRTGGLLGANTLGGLVGSLAAGFVLVPMTPHGGVRNTLFCVSLLHMAIALVVATRAPALLPRARLTRAALVLAAMGLVAIARPDLELPFLLDAWHDVPRTVLDGPSAAREEPVFLREGRNTTVSLLRRGETLRLFNDGRPESGMDLDHPGFGREVALLGVLPAALAERTERAMVIGLGGGHTVTTLLACGFAEVVVVELEEAVVEAARRMHDDRNRRAARPVPFPLDDARARLVVDDARARLKLTPRGTLDAVMSQPSHPWLADASALYTRELFDDVRRALRQGGVFSLWVNLFRMDQESLGAVVATLRAVFPHVLAFRPDDSSFVFTASMEPLTFDARAEARLAASTALIDLLRPFSLDTVEGVLANLELDDAGTLAVAIGRDALTDDVPRLEYTLAALPPDQNLGFTELDAWIAHIRWLADDSALVDETLSVPVVERRIARVRHRPVALARVEDSLDELRLARGDRAYLRGMIAERRGLVDEALAHYESAATGPALTRADALLRHVGESRALLERALTRHDKPDDFGAALLAALAVDDRDALATILEARVRGDMTSKRLVEFSSAYAAAGCDGVLGSLEALRAVAAHEPFKLLHTCEATKGEPKEAERALVAWLGRLEKETREAFAAAREADVNGNIGAAILELRATLSRQPGHPGASTRWLEILVAEGRIDEARDAMQAVSREAELRDDGSLVELESMARRLGL